MRKLFHIYMMIQFINIHLFPQQFEWAQGGGGIKNDYSYSTVCDSKGNVYITGSFSSNTISFGPITIVNSNSNNSDDVFIAKYDQNGNVLWVRSASGGNDDISRSITVDKNDNVYITGIFYSQSISFGSTTLYLNEPASLSSDIFLVKYDSSGSVIWAKSAGGYGNSEARCVKADTLCNVYITGSIGPLAMTFGSIQLVREHSYTFFLAKYDSSGQTIWVKAAGHGVDEGLSIAIDIENNAIVTGYFTSNTISFGDMILDRFGNQRSMFLVKYDGIGNVLWAQSAGGEKMDNYGYSTATDFAGNVYVTGIFDADTIHFGSTVLLNSNCNTGSDIFLVKYSSTGSLLWAKSYGGFGNDWGYDVGIDRNGDILTTGFVSSNIIFDGISLTSSGIFVTKFNSNGNVIWAKQIGDLGHCTPSLSTNCQDDIFLTGWFNDQVNIELTTINNAGSSDIFIVKLHNGPKSPKSLSATFNYNSVELKWNHPAGDGINKYIIYGGISANPTTILDSIISPAETTKTIFNLTNGQCYYFRITSVDTIGQESNYSNEVNGIPNNKIPIAAFLRDTVIITPIKQRNISLTYHSEESYDIDGTIDSVFWYVNNKFKQVGPSFTYNFGPGTNIIMLIVKDNHGATDTSTAVITKMYFKNTFNGPIYSGVCLASHCVMYSIASGDAIYKMNADGVVDYFITVSPGEIRSAGVGSDGSVYLASLNTNIYGFSSFATALWPAVALGGQASSTPVVDFPGNRLYIGVSNRNFLSIQRNTGEVKSGFFADAPIVHSPIITKDRRLIFSTIKGTVYGVNMNGKSDATATTWTLNVGDSISTSPAVDYRGYVYFGTTGGKVIKVLMKTNQTPSVVWQSNLNSPITSSPVIDANGVLYVGTADGHLCAINSSSGAVHWKYHVTSAIRSTASISLSGMIYFGDDSGTLYVLDSQGVLQWHIRGNYAITAPTLVSNGIVYFGNEGGELIGVYDGDTHTSTTFDKLSSNDSIEYLQPVWGTYQGNNYRNGIQEDTIQTLPVEMVSFVANVVDRKVHLSWGTVTETDNYGFEIERKSVIIEQTDLSLWKSIGFLEGSGSSNTPNTYSFTDNTPTEGRTIYRIRQMDRNGQVAYSNEVEVFIEAAPSIYSLSQNFPNPFNPTTTIRYGLPSSSEVSLKIYNAIGQQLAELVSTNQPAGWHETKWNAKVSTGLYFYRIDAVSTTDPNKRFTQMKKMLLLK